MLSQKILRKKADQVLRVKRTMMREINMKGSSGNPLLPKLIKRFRATRHGSLVMAATNQLKVVSSDLTALTATISASVRSVTRKTKPICTSSTELKYL